MDLQYIKTGLLNLKDAVQGVMYALLSYSRAYVAMASPLAFFFRPLLSLTLMLLALIQLWFFMDSPHHNIDSWMITAGSLTSAVLNNIASIGGFIMRLQGSSFFIAPWLLVSGFGLSSLYRFVLTGLNFWRAFESPAHSTQRQHFLQLALFNLVMAFQLVCCSSAIVLFNLAPAYSFFIATVALSVVAINLSSTIWRALTPQSRTEAKELLGLSKPKEESVPDFVCVKNQPFVIETVSYRRLFTTADHIAFIKKMEVDQSRDYLLSAITRKLSLLEPYSSSEKHGQKISVLQHLRDALLQHDVVLNTKQLHQQYPHLGDNFWCEKSDTEQLVRAVEYYKKHSLSARTPTIEDTTIKYSH